MPSGYTSELSKGDQSFEEFMWGCARAFGALIHMRDSRFDDPISCPDTSSSSNYHRKSLEEAKKNARNLMKMSLEDIRQEMRSDIEKVKISHANRRDENRLKWDRYRDMLDKVKAWDPPTQDHVQLKVFMIRQLTESIDFDCTLPSDLAARQAEEMKKLSQKTPEEWYAEERASIEHDIEYHSKNLNEERDRDTGRADWIRALDRSVPCPNKKGDW